MHIISYKNRLIVIRISPLKVPRPDTMTRKVVTEAIDRSLTRMRTDSLDLLQFHW